MVSFHHTQPGVAGHFDVDSGILRIAYSGNVTPEITGSIYTWGWKLSEGVGVENIHGMITDFRAVVKFAPQSLGAAVKESRRINKAFDLSRLPVALIVRNLYQEHMVKISTDLSGNSERRKIVYSDDEALAFIENWHASHSAGISG
ncbi:MAG: hypothetical protein L0154_19210 [Chloroflexi bacterium]|nr:hypothetical protein [Chloroflexota bacterium]